ncbi:MAG: hypothetical protein ACOYJK_03170 [Prevotella sp.]|jgi:hypothetical protein
MNKILRLATVAALALISSFTVAQSVITFNGDAQGNNTTASGKDQMSKDGITIETTAGGFACVNYNTQQKEYRFAKSSTNTFTSTVGNITKVVFTCTKNDKEKYGPGNFANPTAGKYTYEGNTGTWTGNAASFTLTAASSQVRATKIEITINGEVTPPTPPTTEGAKDIATFNDLPNGTVTDLTLKDAEVLFTWTSNNGNTQTFVRDATGAVMFYNTGLTLEAGQKLNGTVTLTRGEYNGTIEAMKADGTNAGKYTVTPATVEPKDIAIADADQNISNLVKLTGVNITSELSGKYTNYYAALGTEKIQLYNGFHLNDLALAEGTNMDVVGIVTLHNGMAQINPTKQPEQSSGTGSTIKEVANIAAFNALTKGEIATLTLNNAEVLYSWTSNNGNTQTFVRDATGAVMFYNTGLTLETGKKLNGTVTLKRDEFNGTIEAVKTDKTNGGNITAKDGTVEPKVITPTEANENLSNLVQLNNVNIVSEVSGTYTNYYAELGTDKIQLYNGFHLDGYKLAEAEGVDVVGIVTLYKDNYQIQPTTAPVATGIGTVKAAEDDNAPVYNVSGQRVGASYKGLVIKNGKKYIRK